MLVIVRCSRAANLLSSLHTGVSAALFSGECLFGRSFNNSGRVFMLASKVLCFSRKVGCCSKCVAFVLSGCCMGSVKSIFCVLKNADFTALLNI